MVVIDSELARSCTVARCGRAQRAPGHRSFRVIGVAAPWKARTAFLGLTTNARGSAGPGHAVLRAVEGGAGGGRGPAQSGKCGKTHQWSVSSPRIWTIAAGWRHGCRWIPRRRVQTYARFLSGYAQAQHAAGRFVYQPKARLYGTMAWMNINHVVPDDVSLNMMLAGGFLLLCMINVAGLLAARFLRRQGESRSGGPWVRPGGDIFAQHVVEAGLLGLLGGWLLALPLTLLGLWIVRMQPVAYAAAAHFSPACSSPAAAVDAGRAGGRRRASLACVQAAAGAADQAGVGRAACDTSSIRCCVTA